MLLKSKLANTVAHNVISRGFINGLNVYGSYFNFKSVCCISKMKLIKPFLLDHLLQASESTNTQLSCLGVCNLSHITLESSAHS